jgi:putative oxidoreductase
MADTGKLDRVDAGTLILRILVGGLLAFHGISKLIHGIGFIEGALAGIGLPGFIGYGVYVGEVLAPAAIILGLWTRLASLVVAFDLVVAILLVRLPAFFTISKSGGWGMEQDFFFLLGALALFLLGPGRIRLGRGAGFLA